MPSGKAHDLITVLLAAPVAAGSFAVADDALAAGVATAGFLFGGLMFGPDLDTTSKQYSRWGPLRSLWFPYRMAFKHRSRWSHGLLLGTLIRVAYFLGIVAIAACLLLLVLGALIEEPTLALTSVVRSWGEIGRRVGEIAGPLLPFAVFAGMWLGAASHTAADLSISYIKTGRAKSLF